MSKKRRADNSTVTRVEKITPSSKYIILANVNIEAMDDNALEQLQLQLLHWWSRDDMPFLILNEGALKLVKIDEVPEIIRVWPEE